MQRRSKSESWFKKVEGFHPYQTLLYLGMIGSGLLFLFLVIAFLFSGLNQLEGLNHKVPYAFLLSTFLLVASGYTAIKMRIHYQEDNIPQLKSSLQVTFLLGLAFAILQVFGWIELSQMGIRFTGIPSGSFLYLLSGIHVFHLAGALAFALSLLLELRGVQQDAIKNLVWRSNPYHQLRIRLFTVYWQFMDVLWLCLFLLFVLSF
ncbi:MAG: cytochrome c oxidase subunit 3 [Bacteroidetes bacterium]|nr:cytochrome c oxidase subunit 3 [Bacteroidota bacterium]